MTATSRVLWLDNDPGYIFPFVMALKRRGIDVTVARTITDAEDALVNGQYDVLLLDVMIPVRETEIARGYTASSTDDGFNTGLAFYRRHRTELAGRTAVFALTVRSDQSVRDEFLAAGLPAGNFITKMELRDASVFVSRLRPYLRMDDAS